MQNPGLRFDAIDPAVVAPGRAQQDQGCVAGLEVHGHGPAARRADDDIGSVPAVSGLGDVDGQLEVIVIQGGIEYLMSQALQKHGFHAAWS